MEAGAPTSCQTVEEKKKNRTWYHYDNSLYRIIQEIFINLIFVKFIDSSPLSNPTCYTLFPWMTLVTVHVVNIFTFYNKVWMLSMPWGRVSCTCMAASVAMVTCACLPHLIKPLCRGFPLRLIRGQRQCQGVAFGSDSQNAYR